MPKKIINDILINKKSIRQIPVSERVKKMEKQEEKAEAKSRAKINAEYEHRSIRSINWQRKPLNPKFILWLIACVCILALFFGISILFSSATLVVTSRTENITFNNELYIAKASSSAANDLSFEILNTEQTIGEVVTATEEKDVEQKATGKIIIFNNYSTVSQRLINNTRFESTNGKVYRINSSIVVPGYKKVNGQIIPGSVEATVFADQAGEGYNMKVSDLTGDFKIPGFKGDPRYDQFYARIKEDIVGGFIGKQRIVSDEVRQSTENLIKDKLKEQLVKQLYAIKPDNYIVFNDGYFINYKSSPDIAVESNKVKINIKGNLNAIVFNNNKLAEYFATKKIQNYDGLKTEFIPSTDFTISFIGKDKTNLWNNTSLEIKLSGSGIIKWLYDEEAIKKDLAGKKEADLKNFVTKYKDVMTGVRVIFRPVWTRYFPDNLNKIKIIENTL